MLTITDPIKNHITYTWDKLGRNTQHTITHGVTGQQITISRVFDTQKKGMLASISGDGHTQAFTYDELCRIKETTETYPGLTAPYRKSYGYDGISRPVRETWTDYGVSILNRFQEGSGILNQIYLETTEDNKQVSERSVAPEMRRCYWCHASDEYFVGNIF